MHTLFFRDPMEKEFVKILLLDMNIIYKVLYVFNSIRSLIFKI